MIPSAFQINVTGDGNSPVPVKITIGPGLLFLGICTLIVLLVRMKR